MLICGRKMTNVFPNIRTRAANESNIFKVSIIQQWFFFLLQFKKNTSVTLTFFLKGCKNRVWHFVT
jgi:hypothetical protein